MTNFDHDDLPPDLADLGRRMRDERPVAEDAALDRMRQGARTPIRQTPRRTPRRAFAVSLATMLAMVSMTGVAAAALFGMNIPLLGKALTSSSQKVGIASSQALQAPSSNSSRPASTSNSRIPSTVGSAVGSLGSLGGVRPNPGGSTSAALLPGPNPISGNQLNAGLFQYGPGRLVCRILRALGLRLIARLLGCP